MHTEKRSGSAESSSELFSRYMSMIGQRDSTATYRLKSNMGEGIMRRYSVEKGVELVYSEIESYTPMFMDKWEDVTGLEIMYMVDGHADFEMDNRFCASADKGDVILFSNHVGTRECRFGPGGIRCVSIVIFLDDLADTLNRFFSTQEFDRTQMFADVLQAKTCVCFPANDMLASIFTGLLQIPEKYADYHRKLLTLQAVVSLLDTHDGRGTGFRYFSGDTARKVHEARKLLGGSLGASLSVEALAEAVKLNRTTLQQVFRQMYGLTIYEYRTQVRIQEAKNLLLSESLTVTEIAGMCGYSNASKFAAVFGKITGMPPAEWRRRMRN